MVSAVYKNIIWPDEALHLSLVMEAIYGKRGIKAGYLGEEPKHLLLEAVGFLKKHGAEAIVAGCTEVPLVLSQKDHGSASCSVSKRPRYAIHRSHVLSSERADSNIPQGCP